jgi:exosome complex RNA-binding protein Rrp42 (RNase PH superfamily)
MLTGCRDIKGNCMKDGEKHFAVFVFIRLVSCDPNVASFSGFAPRFSLTLI